MIMGIPASGWVFLLHICTVIISNALTSAVNVCSINERGVASRCLARCCELGPYRFNAALGETYRLAFAEWVDAEAMARWLVALPDRANSGDIYARL